MNNRPMILLIVYFLLSQLGAHAQIYLFGRADLPVGKGANSIAMGDFNGDGIIDLAVVNEADSTVSVLLGKSDGTFAPQVTYATGLGPLAIVTGDFDGDGNLDLAVTNGDCVETTELTLKCDVRTVSILLGNGNGSFRPHLDYATGTQPSSLTAGDFNGDGKLDLAIANTQDNTVSVLLGNGDGTFQSQVTYPTTPGPQSVIAADFNGDHRLDLAVGGNGVSILLGNSDGTFQAAVSSPGGSPLAVADFNRDGKLDLFAGGSILLGNGDGTFTLYATYPSGSAAAAADLNGDGKPDLVIAQGGGTNDFGTSTSVAVLLGNGDGTFQSAALYGTAVYPSSVVIGDFNGDGKPDLAIADPGCQFASCSATGTASVFLGFGDGTFVGGNDYSMGPSQIVGQVVSADFDGDGKPDLGVAAVNAEFPNIGVLLGNGDGTFQPTLERPYLRPSTELRRQILTVMGKLT